MKILFLCKHNRFRSKITEAIFDKLNKNEKLKAESAGFILDEAHPYIAEAVRKVAKEMGYSVRGKPRQLTRQLLEKFDVLIIVADNISKEFFHDYKGKIIQWKIPDCDQSDAKRIKEIIGRIEEKVKDL